jgi:hypothetical protein
MPITLNKLKDRIRAASVNIYEPLYQNVWHEAEYHSDMCRTKIGANIKLEYGKNLSELLFQCCAFSCCMAITFTPINLYNHSHF